MIVFFPVLVALAALLLLPAWIVSRGRGEESRWFTVLSLPALAAWVVMTAFGFGAQSLSNIVEVFWLAAAGIALGYGKVFIWDRFGGRPARNTWLLMALLTAAAAALRALMPVLPE